MYNEEENYYKKNKNIKNGFKNKNLSNVSVNVKNK